MVPEAMRRLLRGLRGVTGRAVRRTAVARADGLVPVARVVLLAAVAGLVCLGTPVAAHAAGPNSISVAGPGLSDALTIRSADHPEQFTALLGEVSWLASRPGQARAPQSDKLGPKYVVTVFANDKAAQRYELFPLASGGPRAYRPASQPDKRRPGSAWFYARLSMPETLRTVGVPLSGTTPAVAGGGIGGGELAGDKFDPNSDLNTMLAEWRQFLLLNGAVVVVITLGLAGISLLVRRGYDRQRRR